MCVHPRSACDSHSRAFISLGIVLATVVVAMLAGGGAWYAAKQGSRAVPIVEIASTTTSITTALQESTTRKTDTQTTLPQEKDDSLKSFASVTTTPSSTPILLYIGPCSNNDFMACFGSPGAGIPRHSETNGPVTVESAISKDCSPGFNIIVRREVIELYNAIAKLDQAMCKDEGSIYDELRTRLFDETLYAEKSMLVLWRDAAVPYGFSIRHPESFKPVDLTHRIEWYDGLKYPAIDDKPIVALKNDAGDSIYTYKGADVTAEACLQTLDPNTFIYARASSTKTINGQRFVVSPVNYYRPADAYMSITVFYKILHEGSCYVMVYQYGGSLSEDITQRTGDLNSIISSFRLTE